MARSRTPRRVLLALAIAAVPAGVACTSIVGLDDFTKTQCPGAVCSDGGLSDRGPDVGETSTVDGQGAAPVAWAHWRMPNYDAGPETSTRSAYVEEGDVLRDDVTQLRWKQSDRAGLSYAEAKAECKNGFRLPTRIELVTLLDLPSAKPSTSGARINDRFTSASASEYWTSSPVRPTGSGNAQQWVVDFADGNVKKRAELGTASVRCVQGVAP